MISGKQWIDIVSESEDKKKIAIYCMNGIGNFIMWSPFIRAARNFYDAEIHIITCLEDGWRFDAAFDICRRSPLIDKIIRLDQEEFYPEEYHKIFWSHHNEHTEFSRELLAKIRTKSNFVELKNKLVEISRYSWPSLKIHEVEYYMTALYDQGYKGSIPYLHCPRTKKGKLKTKGFRVTLCNGAFTGNPLWLKKLWPVENWIKLTRLLKNYLGAEIALVGGDNLKEYHDEIPSDQDFTGKLSITETAQVLYESELFITTDTGPMHIGASQGKPMIALFGSTHLTKNKPWVQNQKKCRVVQHRELDCVPCQDTPQMHKCEDYQCMKSITPAEVMHEVRGMVKDGFIRLRPMHSSVC